MPLYLLAALLVFAPLAYGTTGPLSIFFVEAACFGLSLWVWLRSRRNRTALAGLQPLLLISVLYATYLFFQLIPLPPGFLEYITPGTASLYRESVWLLNPEQWMPISVHPHSGLIQFFRVASYIAFFYAAIGLLGSLDSLRKLALILTVFGGIYAALGLLQFFLSGERVFWLLARWPERTSHHFASYVNGNHFAGLMEMLIPLAIAVFFMRKRGRGYGNLRQRFVDFFDEPANWQTVAVCLAILAMTVAVFFSLSRGGMLSLALALSIFFMIYLWQGRSRLRLLVLLSVFIAAVALTGLLGWDPVMSRFELIYSPEGTINTKRFDYWADSWSAIQFLPLFGSGAGSFVDIFPSFQTVVTSKTVDHAHNDYLEMLTETGIIGVGLLTLFFGMLFSRSIRAWRLRRNPVSRQLTLGALCGLLAVFAHSFLDFNLQIHANGLYFVLLCAVLWSASHGSRKTPAPQVSAVAAVNTGFSLLASGAVIVGIACFCFNLGSIVASRVFLPVAKIDLAKASESDLDSILLRAGLASLWDPVEARYPYATADVLSLKNNSTDAVIAYRKALRLRPLDAELLQDIGLLAARRGDKELGNALLAAGVDRHEHSRARVLTYVTWLLQNHETEKAILRVKRFLTFYPRYTSDLLTLLALYDSPWDQLDVCLPDRAEAWRIYADFLVELKEIRLAESAYSKALTLNSNEMKKDSRVIFNYYQLLFNEARVEDALQVLLEGVRQHPESAQMHRQAGQTFEQLGVVYKAVEHYRIAQSLDPADLWIQQRLAWLGEK